MAAIFAFRCSCCGEVHEGSPSFGYRAPRSYDDLSDADKERIATIDSDLCKIEYPDQTDYFARCQRRSKSDPLCLVVAD